MVPAATPRAASLCLALLPLAAGHAHPHAPDHALLLLGEGQPLDGLQSELFAPWRSDACHDPTEWCWTGADGAASVDLGDGRYAWLFGDSLVSRDVKRRIQTGHPRVHLEGIVDANRVSRSNRSGESEHLFEVGT